MKINKKKLLFVCLGHICRSPAAEGVMKSIINANKANAYYEVDSAGIGNWHVGQLPDSRMRACGLKRGYVFNSHARQFTKSDFIIRKTKRSEKIKRSDVFRKTKCSFFDFPTHNLKTPQKTLGRFKFLNHKNLTHSNRTSRSHHHQAVALFALNCSRICLHFRDSV